MRTGFALRRTAAIMIALVVMAPQAFASISEGPADVGIRAPGAGSPGAFEVAWTALDSAPAANVAPQLIAIQRSKITAARKLMNESLSSVELARAAGGAQQEMLAGARAPAADKQVTEEAVSKLAHSLLARYGVKASDAQVETIASLDELPAPAAAALSHYLATFMRFDHAARAAYANVDRTTIDDTRDAGEGGDPIFATTDATRVVAARAELLDAALQLEAAAAGAWLGNARSIAAAPALCVDFAGANSTYTQDCAVTLDAGGNDTYLNNAGGSNLQGGACPGFTPTGAAALIDFSGNDKYGAVATDENPAPSVRSCGANGGGYNGAGFLVDFGGGNDTYTGGEEGVNGAGSLGAGFLFDQGGNDTYSAGDTSVNGGGSRGSGFLVDASGHDSYTGGNESANGGAFVGSGFLFDAGGNDTYTGGNDAINGGGNFGAGFLFDTSGNDAFTAGGFAVNGGATLGGPGFLIDGGGNDSYVATALPGVNGGGFGVALLFDAAGSDVYRDPVVPGGEAKDCTILLKELTGIQFDAPNADC